MTGVGLWLKRKSFAQAMVTVEEKLASFSDTAIDAPFIGNHDTNRGAGIFGYDSVKIKAACRPELNSGLLKARPANTQRKSLHCTGKTQVIDTAGKDIAALRRTWEDESIVIVYNFSEEEKSINDQLLSLDNPEIRGYLTVSSEQSVKLDGELKMPPYSIAFLTEK